jgi:5S rRNA maturation endonuclease (ribonuclease M5)
MPLTAGFINKQLNRVAVDRNIKINEHTVWLRCPFHGKGQESTGSLILNLDSSKGYRPGSWKCFGCGEFGQWNDIAATLKLKPYKKSDADDLFLEITDHAREEILGDDRPKKLKPEIQLAGRWPAEVKWRNIRGDLVRRLGGRAVTNEFGSSLYLPVQINRSVVGGVTCRLTRFAKRKYIFDAGGWTADALYPYDYVRRQLNLRQRRGKRVVVLVEGVRDALNLIQHGLLALAILGGKTVWGPSKANLLMTLEPDLVILAFDPDEIGREVTDMARDDLHRQVKLMRIRFPRRRAGKTKSDPGNMKRRRIKRIVRQLDNLFAR